MKLNIRKNFPKNRLPPAKAGGLFGDFSLTGKFFRMFGNDRTLKGAVFNVPDIIDILLVFSLGFLSASFIGVYLISEIEFPFVSFLNFSINNKIKTPSDFIDEKQIEIHNDKIVIYVKDASISQYAPTGSMKPVLDENTNGIRIKPSSEDEINIGDIITFREDNILIIHRVIEKGNDNKGVYFITKGDNNLTNDNKIRFKDIEYKTVGVLW